ncbi:MAG: class I SAM-dependent DNA methyltransferase [Geminicoccaceae bacterium]
MDGQQKAALEKFYEREDPWQFSQTIEDQVRTSIILDFVRHGQFRRALDIGCGEGWLTKVIAGHVEHILGFDLSERAINRAIAKDIPNATFFAHDLRELAALESGYDLILCSESLYYLADEAERRSAVAAMYDLLTDDGLVIVSSIVTGPSDQAYLGERYFSLEELKELLAQRFRIVAAVPNLVRRPARGLPEKALRAAGRAFPSARVSLRKAMTLTTPLEDAFQATFVAIKRVS